MSVSFMTMKIIILVLFTTLTKYAVSEYFSSTDKLRNLAKYDQKFLSSLKELSKELERTFSYVQKMLKNINEEHVLMTNDIDSYIVNPLNAFALIKRLSHDVDAIQKNLEFTNKFTEKLEKIKLSQSELTGAVEGIYRLQHTYELTTEQLARGIIQHKRYRRELLPSDLIVLAKEVRKFDEKYMFDYIKVAKELSLKNDEQTRMSILEQIFEIYNSTSKYDEAVEVLDEILKINPSYQKYDETRMNIELLSLFNDKNEQVETTSELLLLQGSHFTDQKESKIFNKSCRQEVKKPVHETSKLHCRFISKTYFTKIAPFKFEEANLDPYIGIYHNVISDKEIETLKRLARKNLIRAKFLSFNKTAKVSRIRVAQSSWLDDRKHKILQTLNKRVNDMTGLSMETAESWQIQNYGIGNLLDDLVDVSSKCLFTKVPFIYLLIFIGGFYGAHHDYADVGQSFGGNTGNRIATTLFYLSNVEKGGATVFPLLRVYVPPVKGTAVFWHNLSSSGEREYLTRHAACPVLVGSKWVANKWIREYGQESTRPCEQTPKQTDEKYFLKFYNLADYGIDA